MFCYRITKYNPICRNSQDFYLKDEWTSYSDIGTAFESIVLTREEYLKVENAYVEAIISFMECLNIDTLQITDLEQQVESNPKTVISLELFNALENGKILNKEQIKVVSRMILREQLWCKLNSKNMYVHFGYDYYLYIGSSKACKTVINLIEKSGLFAELYKSPYKD